MKKLFLLILMTANFICASALRIEYGNNIVITQPVYGDLYIAAGTITINAPVHGDLVVAGGTIIINDTITNDILLVGGKATFNGFVGDDIRCAGGEIRITKNVTGDVVVTSGSVIIDKGITIGGLLASGGKITVDGNVAGEIRGVFGELFLNGNVAKSIDCRGGSITVNGNVDGSSTLSARHLVIGKDAVFNNNVLYWNKNGTLDFKQSMKNGTATYDPSLRIKTGEWYYLGAATILGLLWYLGMALLMICMIQYLFSVTMKKAADTVFDNTLKSLGLGFLFFIVVPIIAVVAFITMIGVPVGLLLVFGYILLVILATVITSVIAANWVNNRYDKKWTFGRLALTAFGIFILLKLVLLAPFVGWLVMCILICISFGSILLNINWKGRRTVPVTSQ